MSTGKVSFDNTIWEPGGEHAIEDPMHGPSAVYSMLEIPPMSLGNGTYYQTGAFYAVGTPYFDAKGNPIYRVGTARGATALMQEALAVNEWSEAARQGEDALTSLEAQRQQKRLEQRGAAHAFKSSDVCAGGRRMDTCETASAMVAEAEHYNATSEKMKIAGDGRSWSNLMWLGRSCVTCSLQCEVAVETDDNLPTGIVRFTNTRPLSADIIDASLHIDETE
jgi:hypothetical protein